MSRQFAVFKDAISFSDLEGCGVFEFGQDSAILHMKKTNLSSMVTFRPGDSEDVHLIARLHAESWKASYRGILSDYYLDHEVDQERFSAWETILSGKQENLRLIIAEDQGQACGFSGIYLNRSRSWGSYIDNLHVLPAYQGKGIGAQLLIHSARKIAAGALTPDFYLWVFTANRKARVFYEKMRCQYADSKMVDNPDGTHAEIIRCVWRNAHSPLTQR